MQKHPFLAFGFISQVWVSGSEYSGAVLRNKIDGYSAICAKSLSTFFLNRTEYLNFISFNQFAARRFMAVFTLRIPYSLTRRSTPICQHIAPLWRRRARWGAIFQPKY